MFALEVCLAPIQCAYGSGRAPTSSNETQQTAQILSVRKVLRNQYFVSRYPQIHYYMTRLRFLTKSRMYLQEYRWELGASEARAPASGSAKRQRSPLVLSSEQVKLGLAELEFRDQLLVFLEGALGIRQGEPGALRWLSCDFDNMSISVQHSYYWRRGGNLKSTKTEVSAKLLPMHPSLKHSLQEWRSQSLYNKPGDFVFPSERLQGSKPLDLASVLKKKIQPAFRRIGITGVGWHTFRHSVGTSWRRWANISSPSATTCGTATFMSRTSTCRRHRRPNVWRRTNWSTLFRRRVFCRRQT